MTVKLLHFTSQLAPFSQNHDLVIFTIARSVANNNEYNLEKVVREGWWQVSGIT